MSTLPKGWEWDDEHKDLEWTADMVKEAVAEIADNHGDDETAHTMEDTLHAGVLKTIARGNTRVPAKLAELALATQAIGFARWCA